MNTIRRTDLNPSRERGESGFSVNKMHLDSKSPIEGRFRGVCNFKSPIEGRFRGVRVFTLLCFLLLSTLTARAEDYLLWLGSTQVTSANKDNILNETKDGQPTAKYDPINDLLTLNNPTISATAPSSVNFDGGKFMGQYDPFEITSNNINQIIFLGSGNSIGYAKAPRTLHPFRAHFEMTGSNTVKAYKMKFGNEETETGIMSLTEMKNEQGKVNNEADAWYDMSGRKLDGKPTKKGLYIHNGRKVAIK